MAISKLNSEQVIRREHDEKHNAKRVKMVETEMSVELNANDGDSVETRSMNSSISLVANEEFNIAGYTRLAMYGQTNADLMVAADNSDSPEWFSVGNLSQGQVKSICAVRAKFNKDVKVVLQG